MERTDRQSQVNKNSKWQKKVRKVKPGLIFMSQIYVFFFLVKHMICYLHPLLDIRETLNSEF